MDIKSGENVILVHEDAFAKAQVVKREFKTHTEYCSEFWQFIEDNWWLYGLRVCYIECEAVNWATWWWKQYLSDMENWTL